MQKNLKKTVFIRLTTPTSKFYIFSLIFAQNFNYINYRTFTKKPISLATEQVEQKQNMILKAENDSLSPICNICYQFVIVQYLFDTQVSIFLP